MSIRLKRLYADFQLLSNLFYDSKYINIQEYTGNPPERYVIEYKVKGIVESNGKIIPKDMHLVEVILPRGYPREAPFCRMLSPVYHPNISPQQICIGDHWAAGESLSHLLIRIAEMICFQSYNLKSPLNGEAARWTDLNIKSLPLEKTDFYSEYSEREAQILADPSIPPKEIVTLGSEQEPAFVQPSLMAPPPVIPRPGQSVCGEVADGQGQSFPLKPQSPEQNFLHTKFVQSTPAKQGFASSSRVQSPSIQGQRSYATCENCGRPIQKDKIYCNDCYSKQHIIEDLGIQPPPAASKRMPGLFTARSKMVCENCKRPLVARDTVQCSYGHTVCRDCSFCCQLCGRYFCTLCGKDKFSFLPDGIICFRCSRLGDRA